MSKKSPSTGTVSKKGVPPFVIRPRILTPRQCTTLIEYFLGHDESEIEEVKFGKKGGRLSASVTLTGGKHQSGSPYWPIFKRIYERICEANKRFGFKLDAYPGKLQVIEYRKGAFTGWHIDGYFSGDSYGEYPRRKLAVIIPLNWGELSMHDDPDFYGGELQLDVKYLSKGLCGPNNAVALNAGDGVFLPSFIFHQVTKVTSGTRYSAVMFCEGKPFE